MYRGLIASYFKKKVDEDEPTKLGLACVIKYDVLKEATNSFDTVIGGGGFGRVYLDQVSPTTTSMMMPATTTVMMPVMTPTAIDLVLLDDIINRLLDVRKGRPGKQARLSETEIRQLCVISRDIFIRQPSLLELEAPIKVCGDIHGKYSDLVRLFEYGGFPPEANYLFMGNYVDHGTHSLETICLLLAYKIKYPGKFFLLRGNHECASINRIHGFYDECKRRYNIPQEMFKSGPRE